MVFPTSFSALLQAETYNIQYLCKYYLNSSGANFSRVFIYQRAHLSQVRNGGPGLLQHVEQKKNATGITCKERVMQLFKCCTDNLWRNLTRLAGSSLTNKYEHTVLATILKLAQRVENIMVARVSLYDMQQDTKELIRSICGRLCEQAKVCKYVVTCPDCS